MVDPLYQAFCADDPLFYDKPGGSEPGPGAFATSAPAPDDWLDSGNDTWRSLRPARIALPPQGWKIHVSATPDNAERILTAVHHRCVRRRTAYKHLRSQRILLAANAKYAPRGNSGKFITIYPVDETALRTILAELSEELAGEPGPYILSDLRHGDGPLYTRYGAFRERWIDTGDGPVLTVSDPDGTAVPDRREARFHIPDWAPVPACLAADLAARRRGTGTPFPYTITEALHHSNGGGVYRATRDADGRQIVVKEARPHAGLDGHGTDAVSRLGHEHEILRRLAGIDGVPDVVDLFTVWEHHFLAMQAMPGVRLTAWLAAHYPLTRPAVSEQDIADYTARALSIIDRLRAVLSQVHRRGVVVADLHPANILIDDSDDVSLIDFEVAVDSGAATTGGLGVPGFRAPADRRGVAIDDYAMAVLRLWLFLPLTSLRELAPGNVHVWVRSVEDRFPLPAGFGDAILSELAPDQRATASPCRVWAVVQ
jgi:hypothetical protein